MPHLLYRPAGRPITPPGNGAGGAESAGGLAANCGDRLASQPREPRIVAAGRLLERLEGGCCGWADAAQRPGGPLPHGWVGRGTELPGQGRHRSRRRFSKSPQERDRPVGGERIGGFNQGGQVGDRGCRRGPKLLERRHGLLADLFVGIAAGPHQRHSGWGGVFTALGQAFGGGEPDGRIGVGQAGSESNGIVHSGTGSERRIEDGQQYRSPARYARRSVTP